ncbi:hypothetical protein BY458DRAFT_430707 [Sporodiniella umbellata]|nr:hypothetical protein BY458DRAFT_430707 [Sporodiniella umbellata]
MFLKNGHFYLVSKPTGFVISTNGTNEEGTKITVKEKLWSFDNGKIVSKSSSLVLDIRGGDLRVGEKLLQYGGKKTMAHNQRWGTRNGYIYASADPRLVLEGGSTDPGCQLVTSIRKTEECDLQQWELVPFEE